jgi:hypothetical protein
MKRLSGPAPRFRIGGYLLLAGLLGGCAGHIPLHAQRESAPAAGTDSREQRLQALESRVQLLTQRLDRLQGVPARPAARQGERVPVELQPIRPQLVLSPPPATGAAPGRPAMPDRPVPHRAPALPAPRNGSWVINLASYTNHRIARDKLAEFVAAGVPAEQVEAQVHGATVYRLRVAGFASYRTASAEAESIRARLGLQDTWIARR